MDLHNKGSDFKGSQHESRCNTFLWDRYFNISAISGKNLITAVFEAKTNKQTKTTESLGLRSALTVCSTFSLTSYVGMGITVPELYLFSLSS